MTESSRPLSPASEGPDPALATGDGELDVGALRLRGSALIEASAGTGKTWTLAALFLRLVLGHGDAVQREDRALLPGEILVMTFTRAATRELAGRVRDRLAQAAAVFRGQRATEDTLLQRLLADYPAAGEREIAAWRLERAAQAMDDAAIHTLDAWCQRVLRDHRFDHDAPVQGEVMPDGPALLQEAARDVWRRQVYPLNEVALEVVRELWTSPDDLARDAQVVAESDLAQDASWRGAEFSDMIAASLQTLAQVKAGWAERADAMAAALEPWLVRPDSPFNKSRIKPERVRAALKALSAWALDPAKEALPLKDSPLGKLTPAGLRSALKNNHTLPRLPPCFDEFQALIDTLENQTPRAVRLRATLVAAVLRQAQALKAQRQLSSHHDVQQQLHDALDEARHGERAQHLRERILQRYPVALVDEFQDTSPLQLGILDRLYRIASNDPARLILLIGDPKQSIYAFRGADIHSYLRARRATQGRHHRLAVNRRSSPGMVAAVNQLFGHAEEQQDQGAFRFGGRGAPGALPFGPVRAQGRAERLIRGGAPWPALIVGTEPELQGTVVSRQRYAARCAQTLVEWLSDPAMGFEEPGKPWKRLRPGDVAILVRSHHEARRVRREMQRRDLPSVFLSDRDSVFETPEARDLLRWLQAANDPRDERLVRAALATALRGLSLARLRQLADDDEQFEAEAEALVRLQALWHSQGVLAALRAALHGWALPARWLASPEGERRLTNVLHLAELLQQAAARLDSPGALLRWLERQIQQPSAEAGEAEEQVLRLESDADRVQVVTVHKAKGLEYPVVFVPFASFFRDPRKNRPWALRRVDPSGRASLVLEPGEDDHQWAELEQRREDVRLLYVALTRARHHLWLGASLHRVGNGNVCVWHQSALGHLVSGDQAAEPAKILEDLRTLVGALPQARLDVWTAAEDPALQPRQQARLGQVDAPLAPPLSCHAGFDRQWAISSYSALVRDAGAESGAAAGADVAAALSAAAPSSGEGWVRDSLLRQDEPPVGQPAAVPEAPAVGAPVAPWHRFPRGAFAGNFLHGQLEWLAGEGFARVQEPAIQRALQRRCEREGWGQRAAEVQAWLSAVCTRRLPPLGAGLHELQAPLPEMEFWLPDDGLDTAALDLACQQQVLPQQRRPALAQRPLRGLLMGFADLVFEHGGRWWVLDYKSNALGPDDAAYTLAAMERAVLEHRYDVQAVLYLLPLHRLLRTRLGARYEPARHLGGAIYFFLRGVAAPTAGCCTLPAPLDLLMALDKQLPAGPAEATDTA
ncbi:MAG: exodeoxyribonuclease V subunit beta [Rubrivivax sp.]|nr:exodeoxyribonuclease V subunit beta [Rubrivivax sp.]